MQKVVSNKYTYLTYSGRKILKLFRNIDQTFKITFMLSNEVNLLFILGRQTDMGCLVFMAIERCVSLREVGHPGSVRVQRIPLAVVPNWLSLFGLGRTEGVCDRKLVRG